MSWAVGSVCIDAGRAAAQTDSGRQNYTRKECRLHAGSLAINGPPPMAAPLNCMLPPRFLQYLSGAFRQHDLLGGAPERCDLVGVSAPPCFSSGSGVNNNFYKQKGKAWPANHHDPRPYAVPSMRVRPRTTATDAARLPPTTHCYPSSHSSLRPLSADMCDTAHSSVGTQFARAVKS